MELLFFKLCSHKLNYFQTRFDFLNPFSLEIYQLYQLHFICCFALQYLHIYRSNLLLALSTDLLCLPVPLIWGTLVQELAQFSWVLEQVLLWLYQPLQVFLFSKARPLLSLFCSLYALSKPNFALLMLSFFIILVLLLQGDLLPKAHQK